MISAIHKIYLLKKLKRGECSQEEQHLLFDDPYMQHFKLIVENFGIDNAIKSLSKFALKQTTEEQKHV